MTAESSPVLLGVDVSLKACAVIACPLDWAGDWSRVRTLVTGRTLPRSAGDLAKVRRLEDIAGKVVAFARGNGAQVAWIESYAFGLSSCAHSLGEAGGVLRVELHRAGIAFHTAPISSARKLLLGALPRSDGKAKVQEALARCGCPFETADECDAFAALNWGLREAGGGHLSIQAGHHPHPPRFYWGARNECAAHPSRAAQKNDTTLDLSRGIGT